MGELTANEVDAVCSVLGDAFTTVGFYSHGEISPGLGSGISAMHNQTMTLMTMTEQME
jgi:hypothetical protein